MKTELEVLSQVLDGHSEALSAAQEKIAALERQMHELRATLRATLIEVASELRDDSDWSGLAWRSGADIITEHWWTKLSKRGMALLVGAVAVALLIWLGSLGIIFKKP
jgi:hypothetical protein